MHRQNSLLFLMVFFAFPMLSCKAIYGIRQPNASVSVQLLPAALQSCPCALLGKDFKTAVRRHTAEADAVFRHDLMQPLQLWLFEDGVLVANTVNCYAGGFPNLRWQLQELYQHRYLRTCFSGNHLPDKAVFEEIFGVNLLTQGRVAIIVYSQFMGRQHKRFLEEVAELKAQVGFECWMFGMDGVFQ